jgi:eukaryotic-like serine/threonine-protein kinase
MLEWPEVPGQRYQTIELIGQGGMGAVFLARDGVLGRDVALKVLRPECSDEGLATRLRREARVLARLEHPGIVPVHDAGTLADGRVFYVMKLVRGERLDRFAMRATASEVLRVLLRVVETVGFAHAHGVVHRDLKPANIMIGSFGEVLVLDWGIARVSGEPDGAGPGPTEARDARSGDTAPGTVLGTPGFMAPEQAQGQVHLVDRRTDIFALGAMLRVLAAGWHPPRRLAAIWSRASAADPVARYQTTEELADDITRYLDGRPIRAHHESLGERVARVYAKYQTAIILVLAYLAMRLLFLAARGF